MDDKTLEKCKNIALTELKTSGCVGYKVFNDKGQDLRVEHTACYSSIRTDNTENCIVINKLQTDAYNGLMKEPKIYLNWLINDSAFAETFISKDADQVLQEGLIISDCNCGGSLLVGGMTAMRGMWENDMANQSSRFFNSLVNAGCTPDFAFIMCHGLTSGGSYSGNMYGAHSAINFSSLFVHDVKNFIFHRPKKQMPFYKNNYYKGIHDLWNKKDGDLPVVFSEWIHDELANLVGEQKLLEENLNPFAATPATKLVRELPKGVVLFKALAQICNKFYNQFIDVKGEAA
jgi:hypothetical protein